MANLMTLLRLALTFPTVVAVLKGDLKVALFLTILAGLSDMIDGRVARRSGNANGVGKILDPYADKVFTLLTLIALVEAGMVSSVPVILITFRDLTVSFLRSLSAVQGNPLEASPLAKVKTFLLFSSLILILAGTGAGDEVLWVAVLTAYLSVYEYVRSYLRTISGLNYP
ncbi:MAG: CDP-alcohol phosphatidyltransferase family protein [Aquificota bacterium]|nr:CDP-alcohol phosphatidyltransferase family protein [Aquificota bacterium]